MRALPLVVLGLMLLLLPSRARADDATTFVEWRATDDRVLALQTALTTSADGKPLTSVKVQPLDDQLSPKGKPIAVYDGPRVVAHLAIRAGSAAVLMYRGGAAPFVKVALVDLTTEKLLKIIELPRTAPSGHQPTSAIACADADGFTLLWQEQSPLNPQDVSATMARVKADGTVVKKPTTVAIPWSLGAIVDDGRGYTLAVRYDGGAVDQTRLCFVTLTYDGAPEQHPWWGARPTLVGDVQLTRVGAVVTATYRAGAAGESILSVDADKLTGQWGKEPPEGRVLSKKTSGAFATRVKNGALELVKN